MENVSENDPEKVINSPYESTAIPNEVMEGLSKLPQAEQEIVKSMVLSMRSMSSPDSSALSKRVTPEHITQVLENSEKQSEREFKKSESTEFTKRLGIGAMLVLVFMVFGYAGITKDKDLAEKVTITVISAIGGYGVGVASGKKEP